MSSSDSTSDQSQSKRWNHDVTRAALGGVTTLVIGFGTATLLGSTNRFEARKLVDALSGVLPYLASSTMGASATILALMLTLLGVTSRSERRLAEEFYKRVLWIGRQGSGLFVIALVLLLVLAFPVAEANAFPSARKLVIVQFYVSAGLTALLSGLAVSMILMLLSAVSDLVQVLGLGVEDHPLVRSADA